MLRNIPNILSPDLLWTLQAMGHGDTDCSGGRKFPVQSMGLQCYRMDGISATDALEAVLMLMPLDAFVPDPALVMQMVEDTYGLPPVVGEFQRIIDSVADHPAPIAKVERFAFYDLARKAFAAVQTGESRLYGNIILKKGVIAP
jgi:L-fucose mutarotase